jgi:hypothetical protein
MQGGTLSVSDHDTSPEVLLLVGVPSPHVLRVFSILA